MTHPGETRKKKRTNNVTGQEILNGEPTRPVATPARLAHDGADHSKPAEPEIVASPKVPEAPLKT